MSRAPARKKAVDAYHHGDLREALLEAGRESLETTPPEGVTLKALATRLGVSQPAPYRHFASREALLHAIAEDGFRRFADALREAEGSGPAETAMDRSLAAYVRFAQANRGVYRLMFASNLMNSVEAGTGLAEAAHAAFDILLSSVERRAPPARARPMAVWIWASIHGVVMLESEGLLAGPQGPLPVAAVLEELAEAVRARL